MLDIPAFLRRLIRNLRFVAGAADQRGGQADTQADALQQSGNPETHDIAVAFYPSEALTIEGGKGALKRLKPLKNKAPETRTDRISGEVEATSEGPAGAAERAAITGPNASRHAVNWLAGGGRPECPACPPPGG